MTRNENSKTTGMFDDGADTIQHKMSRKLQDEVFSVSNDPKSKYADYNSNKTHGKRIFFTSSHIKMVERSPKNDDRKSMTMKKREKGINEGDSYIPKDTSSQFDNKWVKSDEEGDASQQPVINRSRTDLKINAQNSRLNSKRTTMLQDEDTKKCRNTPSNSNTDIRSRIKQIKITSQIECVDNVTSMQSDDLNFKSNRR